MKTKQLLTTACFLAALSAAPSLQAQMKIGGTGAPDASAILELNSTNKGLLMPRVSLSTTTTWGLAGTTPIAGMSVYNTNTNLTSSNASYPAAGTGEYYYDGTGWVSKKTAAAAYIEPWYNVATRTPATANTQDIYQLGKVGIGTNNPTYQFSVREPQSSQPVIAMFDNGGDISTDRGISFRNSGGGAFFGYGSFGTTGAIGPKIVAGSAKSIGFFTGGNGTGSSLEPGSEDNILRMTIAPSTGFVGIGTENPGSRLNLLSDGLGDGGTDDIAIQSYGAATGPGFSFYSATGSRATPGNLATNATLGGIVFRGQVNGGSSIMSSIISQYVGDGTTNASNLRLHTSGAARLLVNEEGNVGIGTLAPTQKLHVIGNILASGTITPSDLRIKKDITDNAYGLKEIMRLRTIGYRYKDVTLSKDHKIGFVAQEVKAVLPELVTTADDSLKTLGVNYAEMTVVLTKAVQEQQAQIEALKAENVKLRLSATKAENAEKAVASLSDQIKELQQLLGVSKTQAQAAK
ncbi:hypothetical protein BWI93_02345 [Siphonobacter sp. BAB-5385]|uniref:tail fiber domain-containing protein n=1 Tax=Siphonobacter sp. BAB-5385 TaxID=1864822 RepID=UPI000B9DE861|nr:tail fiber domain-containing protein [Siphonobacter sp. BAB-5385]OZI09725.1 hypothetical protein BWI93_02345 [Siphonobacter sp. BAB-5385]